MLKEQRHQKIIEYINQYGYAKVEDLSKFVNCSEITIRRDLQELEKLRLLTKLHGGASSIEQSSLKADVGIPKREAEYQLEKERIAEKASHFLKNNIRVYLDAGSTANLLIPYLANYDILVFTHGLHHIPKLIQYGISTHVVGGKLKSMTQATVGEMTLVYLKQFHFDYAFMGTNAIDLTFGYSTPDAEEAMIKRCIIEQSSQSFILADKTKFDQKSYVSFATIDDAQIISNENVTDSYREFSV